MTWQHRARTVVAVIGIGCALAVYGAMRERASPAPALPPDRADPSALIESSGAVVEQVRGTRQDFVVKAGRQFTYEGGATRLLDVEISVGSRGGRDYVLKALEAEAGERQQELRLRGQVRMLSSDGLELSTEEAFFNESDGHVRAPGAFQFTRRRLAGAGRGMTYDRTNDVITVGSQADIRLTEEDGNTATRFLAESAVFNRSDHLVLLTGAVHVLHNDQVADAARVAAFLDADDSLLRRVELRGAAEVAGGGGGVERLRAESIDLVYASDGAKLTDGRLEGDAVVVSRPVPGAPGRDIRGQVITLAMAESGVLSEMNARERVRVFLPQDAGMASRRIDAARLDAEAGPDGQLSRARFDGGVVFDETGEGAHRVVRSRLLQIGLSGSEIDAAAFEGAVRFEDGGLQASGTRLEYAPEADSLVVSGAGADGIPRVTDGRVAVEAQRITVAIASRDISAVGGVRTVFRETAAAGSASGNRLPGIFRQTGDASGSADGFEYSGSSGKAVYTGSASLWQAETAVRGDRIVLDQESGNLDVTGNARAALTMATGDSVGSGASIAYLDASRSLVYLGGATTPARLSGPDGDLSASRIVVTLGTSSNGVGRLEAFTNVTLALDTRRAAGDTLVYEAAAEQYVMTGTPRAPVKIVDNCLETTGGTLTFFKSADRIIIDGSDAARTQSVRGTTCQDAQRP